MIMIITAVQSPHRVLVITPLFSRVIFYKNKSKVRWFFASNSFVLSSKALVDTISFVKLCPTTKKEKLLIAKYSNSVEITLLTKLNHLFAMKWESIQIEWRAETHLLCFFAVSFTSNFIKYFNKWLKTLSLKKQQLDMNFGDIVNTFMGKWNYAFVLCHRYWLL